VKREDDEHLPDPIALEDTVAEVDTRPVPDPERGVTRDAADAIEAGG
jgi:hypothetical protein